ncbi:hypothetical protein [Sphingomonas xinjiangensis]|uniref:Uncharacterized protein n=1 Tax=Sphingomonas xinjiangensis TaxID=643568 RepID=A0A840YTK4_9SPHN|nr:hypothetical protein [Sphingomonas xinjiangensis]MBB5713049.1 hypothetical protein [Sphingomonas xinjiangensis]
MNAPFGRRLPQCPCCRSPLLGWPPDTRLRSCNACYRPIIRVPSIRHAGVSRLCSLLDLGFTIYGVLTLILVATFAFSDMSALRFAKLFSVLLFVVGSVLIVEGYLSIRTKVAFGRRRIIRGQAAYWVGVWRLAAGVLALCLMLVGLGI